MPNNLLFCHHCLMYRPTLNFHTSALFEPEQELELDPWSGSDNGSSDKDATAAVYEQAEKEASEMVFGGITPRICFDCDRVMAISTHSRPDRPVRRCTCVDDIKCRFSCDGCEAFHWTQSAMEEQSIRHILEEAWPDERGPHHTWDADECWK